MQEISNIKRDLRIVSRPPEGNKEIDVVPLPPPHLNEGYHLSYSIYKAGRYRHY